MSIQMDQLPVELHIDILSRLPIKYLVRCRCVCKTWLRLTRDPRFTHTHLARSSLSGPSLILNATGDSTGGSIYLTAEHDQTHDYTCTSVHFSAPPDFKEFRLVGSCNGLLCLVHHNYRYMICVCNPFTGECVKLPDRTSSSQRHHETVIGFGFSSKTDEYKVVVIKPKWEGIQLSGCSEVFCYTLGDDESWRDMEDLPCVIMRRSASNASVNGALHWMCAFPVDLIVSFDIADEVYGVIPHPEFGNGYEESCCSLGVLNGCLSIMDSSFYDRVEIWVMEDYGVEESWTRCLSINFGQVGWNIRFCRTVCFGRDGKLLLLYNNQDLFLYDPQTVRMRKLCIDGLPSCFEAISHVGSLVSLSDYLRRKIQL